MSDYTPSSALAGLSQPCPACGAEPDEPCRFVTGVARVTTHQARKPKVNQS